MIEVFETCEVPQENEHKLIEKAKRLLKFFSSDATQWNTVSKVKWILSKAILFIIVLGLGVYTAKTGIVILLDYAKNPTFYFQTAIVNESIALPPSKICLPLSSFELDIYWKYSPNIPPSEKAVHYQTRLTDYFYTTTTKETLLNTNRPWPNFLLFMVHNYVNLTEQFEALSGEKVVQDHYTSFVTDYKRRYKVDTTEQMNVLNDSYNDLLTSIRILDDWMTDLNISAYELKLRYSAEILKSFKFKPICSNPSQRDAAETVKVSFLSIEDGYNCFIAHFDQYPLRRKYSFWIQAERSGMPNPRPDNEFTMTIGIGGRLADDQYNVYYRVPFDTYIYYYFLQISSTFKSLPYSRGEKRCDERKSFDTCAAECRVDYLRAKCDCIPSVDSVIFEINISFCNLAKYINCFKDENMPSNEEARSNLTHCEDNCLDICDRTTYFEPKTSFYSYPLEQDKKATIALVIASFEYPFYEETPKWTLPSFIGVFGGALGLWLGINILDTIILAFRMIKKIISSVKRKHANNVATKSVKNVKENSVDRDSSNKRKALLAYKRISKLAIPINIFGWLLRIALGYLSFMISQRAQYEYLNQNTTTVAQPEHKESIALPNATLRLPLSFGELDSGRNDQLGEYYASVLTEYFNKQNLTKDAFLPPNVRWNNAVRMIAHAYLIEISNCETEGYLPCNTVFAKFESFDTAMDTFEKILSKLNISVDELRYRFGKEAATFYSFIVGLYDYGILLEDIIISQTNYIDLTHICYSIPFGLYPLKMTSHYWIFISERTLPNAFDTGNDRAKIVIDFNNPLFIPELGFESSIKQNFSDVISYVVGLTKYQLLREVKNGQKYCNDLTIDQCESVCRIKFIQGQCNCTPTSWPDLLKFTSNVCFYILVNFILTLSNIYFLIFFISMKEIIMTKS